MREKADEATGLLKALANRNRLMILCQLVEGEQSVGGLAQLLDLRDTVVSQHLGLLRRDGMVTGRRDGQTVYYALRGEAASQVLHTLYTIYCAPEAAREEALPDAAGNVFSPGETGDTGR